MKLGPYVLGNRINPDGTDNEAGSYIELNVGSHEAYGRLVWCMSGDARSRDCEDTAYYICNAANQHAELSRKAGEVDVVVKALQDVIVVAEGTYPRDAAAIARLALSRLKP